MKVRYPVGFYNPAPLGRGEQEDHQPAPALAKLISAKAN